MEITQINKFLRTNYFFWILILIHTLPVWVIEYFHTQDGPVLVYNATALFSILTEDNSFYKQFYEINSNVSPNWLCSILLTFLLYIVKANVAHKLILTLYVILLPISFRYLLLKAKGDPIYALFIFPFVYNYFFFFGFYNYILSISFFFIVLGYYLSNRHNLKTKNFAIIGLLIFIIYWTHVVSYVVSVVSIISIFFCQNYIEENQSRSIDRIRIIIRKFVPLLVALLPTFILFASYFLSSHRSVSLHSETIWDHIVYFLGIKSIVTFDEKEKYLALLLTIIFTINILARIRKCKKTKLNLNYFFSQDILLTLLGILLALFIISPNQLGGGSILKYRLPVYFYFILIVWISKGRKTDLQHLLNTIAILGISFLFLMIRQPVINKMDEDISTYIDFGKNIPSGSTVFPITIDRQGLSQDGSLLSPDLNIYKNIGSYLGYNNQLAILDNYQARTTYFPLIWKEEVNPFIYISKNRDPVKKIRNIEANPPCADFFDYQDRSGIEVDRVLVYGNVDLMKSDSCGISNIEQLDLYYSVESTSTVPPMSLHRKNSEPKSAPN